MSPGLTAQQRGQLGTAGHNGDMGTAGDSGSQRGQQLGWQMGTWGQLGTAGQRGDSSWDGRWGHGDMGTARQGWGQFEDSQTKHGGIRGHPDRGQGHLGTLGTWGHLGAPRPEWGHLGTHRHGMGSAEDTEGTGTLGDTQDTGSSEDTWTGDGDTWGHPNRTRGHLGTPRQGVGSPGDTWTGHGDTWGQGH